MKILRSPRQMQQTALALRARGKKIGFVPTMGYLHEGHLSLYRRARRENDIVIGSLFVNPAQFGPKEDFKRYPRNFSRDRKMLAQAKVDYLFAPSAPAMYPDGFQTCVEPGPLAAGLCGKSRPGHFRGVLTVVNKLFNLTLPHRAYFGQKDYQQALLISRMTEDLALPVQVVICPIVRDIDGLALSSRNVYLDRDTRLKALSLSHALRWAELEARSKRATAARLKTGIRRILREAGLRVDYVEILEARNLSPVRALSGKIVVALAVFADVFKGAKRHTVRLIDNRLISFRSR